MNSNSQINGLSADIRDRAGTIASTIKAEAGDVGTAVAHTVEKQVTQASRKLRTIGKKATRFCRRHPAESVVTALALGFLLGRLRRRQYWLL